MWENASNFHFLNWQFQLETANNTKMLINNGLPKWYNSCKTSYRINQRNF